MAFDVASRYLPWFKQAARERLALLRRLSTAPDLDRAAVGFQLHALAGEAAMLGFVAIAEAARLGERRAGEAGDWTAGECTAVIERIGVLLDQLPREAGTPDSASHSNRPRPFVLVVDDSPIVADTIGEALTRAGFEVSLAETLTSAAEILARRHPDAIVTDLQMPTFDAADVAAAARAAGASGTKLLLVSGASPDELASETGRVGADAAVAKQDGVEAVVARVRELLAVQR